MNRRTICHRAWTICRLAAQLFGGRPIEYISEAMRMAWQGIHKAAYLEMVMPAPKMDLTGSPKQIAWAEKIVATIVKQGREDLYLDAANHGHMHKLINMWTNIVAKRTAQIRTASWWIDHRSNHLLSIVR